MKDNNLSERKEVKVVSSRDRKKGVKKEKKKIKLLDFKKSSKNGNETPRNKNAKSTKKKVKAKNVRSRDMTSINNQRYAQNIQGGFTPLQIGKMGMKILNNTIDHNRGMRYLSAAALIDNKQLILSNWE